MLEQMSQLGMAGLGGKVKVAPVIAAMPAQPGQDLKQRGKVKAVRYHRRFRLGCVIQAQGVRAIGVERDDRKI